MESDSFCFRGNISTCPPTRKGILSVASAIFDPLGILALFVLTRKEILQDLCRIKLGWDDMSRNLARQTSRDLLSDCFAVVSTAGFYCDSRPHNVRKVKVVKCIAVYGQIKVADQKYCHNQKWRRKLKEISFRTGGFGDNSDDFWLRYCRAKVLDLSHVVEAYL